MMKISRYKKEILMSAAALGMAAGLTLESSMAYFTTYVSAGGSGMVSMGATTEITEEPGYMSKIVSITNNSQTNACYVRVKVLYGAQVGVSFAEDDGNHNWARGEDDYWYYGPKLEPGASAAKLKVVFDIPDDFDRDTFNAIVLQECTPVRYREDGTEYADWTTTYTDYEGVPQGEGDGN